MSGKYLSILRKILFKADQIVGIFGRHNRISLAISFFALGCLTGYYVVFSLNITDVQKYLGTNINSMKDQVKDLSDSIGVVENNLTQIYKDNQTELPKYVEGKLKEEGHEFSTFDFSAKDLPQADQEVELKVPQNLENTFPDETLSNTLKEMSVLNYRIASLTHQIDKMKVSISRRREFIAATPSIPPVNGKISGGFGWRIDPIYKKKKEFHYGLDIAATKGSFMVATADGKISFVGKKKGYGKMVIISHGFGIETIYAHSLNSLVKEGDSVTRGQPIGKVGATGRATGAHVHYEVRIDNKPVNPWYFLTLYSPAVKSNS